MVYKRLSTHRIVAYFVWDFIGSNGKVQDLIGSNGKIGAFKTRKITN